MTANRPRDGGWDGGVPTAAARRAQADAQQAAAGAAGGGAAAAGGAGRGRGRGGGAGNDVASPHLLISKKPCVCVNGKQIQAVCMYWLAAISDSGDLLRCSGKARRR